MDQSTTNHHPPSGDDLEELKKMYATNLVKLCDASSQLLVENEFLRNTVKELEEAVGRLTEEVARLKAGNRQGDAKQEEEGVGEKILGNEPKVDLSRVSRAVDGCSQENTDPIVSSNFNTKMPNGSVGSSDSRVSSSKKSRVKESPRKALKRGQGHIVCVCGVRFTRKDTFRKHLKRFEKQVYCCGLCNKVQHGIQAFQMHLKNIHQIRGVRKSAFGCTVCDKSFDTKEKWCRHRDRQGVHRQKTFLGHPAKCFMIEFDKSSNEEYKDVVVEEDDYVENMEIDHSGHDNDSDSQ